MLQFLLTLVDESDREKIERIYSTYHEHMMKYAVSKLQAMGRTNYTYDAEDAVQNAFMKIAKYIDSIDFSRGEKDVKNYCFAVLSNEICNVLNYNQENFEVDEGCFFESDYNYDFVEELEIKEKYEEVVSAIEALDERYSTTLFLAVCREMTPYEIADMMGITVKTVYTRLTRGKKLLFELLEGARING